ncbi:MAG: Hpt domain-containing protein [Lachnospiraceae bacterium]|nr:Hpt domain-containing protein [Lachnospiraceae bacterium]
MLTLEGLKAFGADTESGMARCINNEAFYLKMVEKSLADGSYAKLKESIEANDLDAAFEAAHALKGVLGNLALTPIFEPVSEITELLRARTQTDYGVYLEKINAKYEELKNLCS